MITMKRITIAVFALAALTGCASAEAEPVRPDSGLRPTQVEVLTSVTEADSAKWNTIAYRIVKVEGVCLIETQGGQKDTFTHTPIDCDLVAK